MRSPPIAQARASSPAPAETANPSPALLRFAALLSVVSLPIQTWLLQTQASISKIEVDYYDIDLALLLTYSVYNIIFISKQFILKK
jgi:hypothetical protein